MNNEIILLNNLREIRQNKKLSQEELAKMQNQLQQLMQDNIKLYSEPIKTPGSK